MNIIVACGRRGEIGMRGEMIWHLPEDLRYFKRTTKGHPVIMGRKTWESLPKRPLPGRLNVVVTRNGAYSAPGATVVTSLEEALRLTEDDPETFVIGGAEIYRQALPMAKKLYITEIEAESDAADTYFPLPEASEWRRVSLSEPISEPERPTIRWALYEHEDNADQQV